MCGVSSTDKDGGTGTVVGATVPSVDAGVFFSVFRNASIATDAGTYVDVRCVVLAFPFPIPIDNAVICKLHIKDFFFAGQSSCVIFNIVKIQIVYINMNTGFAKQKKSF